MLGSPWEPAEGLGKPSLPVVPAEWLGRPWLPVVPAVCWPEQFWRPEEAAVLAARAPLLPPEAAPADSVEPA